MDTKFRFCRCRTGLEQKVASVLPCVFTFLTISACLCCVLLAGEPLLTSTRHEKEAESWMAIVKWHPRSEILVECFFHILTSSEGQNPPRRKIFVLAVRFRHPPAKDWTRLFPPSQFVLGYVFYYTAILADFVVLSSRPLLTGSLMLVAGWCASWVAGGRVR
jgi:hypothetical protein